MFFVLFLYRLDLDCYYLVTCAGTWVCVFSYCDESFVLDVRFCTEDVFFHKYSGLSLPAAISFLLDELPTCEFSDFGFDASDAFQSSGFKYVAHPGSRTRNQDNALDLGEGECNIERRPPSLHQFDHRRQIENSAKIFYCDRCWKPFSNKGDEKLYDGNYINKTWNTDEDKKNPNYIRVGRAELYQGWRDGRYDLTWHCLRCHAEFLGRSNDLKGVEKEMRLWQFVPERKRHKRARLEKGFWRKSHYVENS